MLEPEKMEIVKVIDGENLSHVRGLFRAYAEWIAVDLSFQNFNKEFASLPGDYAPPDGALLLAIYEGKPAGCVALRKFSDDICEMKRLYVSADFQGAGVGRRLVDEIIAEGKRLGYAKMRLDTMPKMASAQKLYRKLGFKEIEPYRFNPVACTVFMELDLRDFQIATDLLR
jgi:ribosomal protein S18 acetylase RimI-like enzyme